jgi:hypothetical protein
MTQEPKKDILSEFYKELPDQSSEKDMERLRMINGEFLAGFKLLLNEGPFVTVFGSSRTTPDHSAYKIGYELGRLLANKKISVLTGGGPGCMEAVNKGAKEAGGKSMGINIAIPEEQVANPYAIPSITLDHFFVRKVLLLKYSTAFIFLPGGFGTLDELFETLTLIQTRKIKPFPVILIKSEFWEKLFDWVRGTLLKDGLIDMEDTEYFNFVDSAEEAVNILKETNVS